MQNKKNHLSSVPAANIFADLQLIRNTAPLIHNITNLVTMPFIANTLLALGASPIMAHAKEELMNMVEQSKVIVINIGTLDTSWIESMRIAMTVATKLSIPIVFDPVGAGATHFRTEIARKFLQEYPLAIIRGNASEIIALSNNAPATTKGVDSTQSVEDAKRFAQELAQEFGCVVVVSGATDFITNANISACQKSGHPLMSKVTGMGCVATATIAAFSAVNKNPFLAAIHAMSIMGISGELAAKSAIKGPGSFQLQFLDSLYQLNQEDISHHLSISYG